MATFIRRTAVMLSCWSAYWLVRVWRGTAVFVRHDTIWVQPQQPVHCPATVPRKPAGGTLRHRHRPIRAGLAALRGTVHGRRCIRRTSVPDSAVTATPHRRTTPTPTAATAPTAPPTAVSEATSTATVLRRTTTRAPTRICRPAPTPYTAGDSLRKRVQPRRKGKAHPGKASIVSRATAGPVVMPLPRMPVTI